MAQLRKLRLWSRTKQLDHNDQSNHSLLRRFASNVKHAFSKDHKQTQPLYQQNNQQFTLPIPPVEQKAPQIPSVDTSSPTFDTHSVLETTLAALCDAALPNAVTNEDFGDIFAAQRQVEEQSYACDHRAIRRLGSETLASSRDESNTATERLKDEAHAEGANKAEPSNLDVTVSPVEAKGLADHPRVDENVGTKGLTPPTQDKTGHDDILAAAAQPGSPSSDGSFSTSSTSDDARKRKRYSCPPARSIATLRRRSSLSQRIFLTIRRLTIG
ncbi:MAG: hypothetical protein Q9164_005336 [Protoblastenia rupestris]